ncbi:iron-containing alcohol dehydrogenase [Alicyclobacillus fodiniaquatilis]|uniref:Iron-containing alcohol dehydrogenase n=1 Tax=Alicyclobacillus fodiniaquatilis TaxID=1661150 RepID=A0ABW4JFU8_9BACL
MAVFTYQCNTRIHFGVGTIQSLAQQLNDGGFGRRLMLVTDKGLIQAGLVEQIEQHLKTNGFSITLFHEVKPNPRDTDCLMGAEMFRANWCDALLAVGGGSAMDTAKAIALLARHGGTPADYVDGGRMYGEIAPIACVPTTAGTGSEVTRGAVITEASSHRKLTLKHEWLRPQIAVLDPALTCTVPKPLTAATGVDALVHAIEGFTCKKTQPISQALAAQAMPLIWRALPLAYRAPDNIEARSDMLLGSLLAGLAFGSADVAGVHCLAEALGGLYDTPHGLANAVFLLPMLRYNIVGNESLHAQVARHMGVAQRDDEDEDAALVLIDALAAWLKALDIPPLSHIDKVQRSDSERMVELAMANSSTASNIRPLTESAYRKILEEAFAATF